MKKYVKNTLVSVINALNTVSVSGMSNMLNLTGSIRLLEEVISYIDDCTITSNITERNASEQERK